MLCSENNKSIGADSELTENHRIQPEVSTENDKLLWSHTQQKGSSPFYQITKAQQSPSYKLDKDGRQSVSFFYTLFLYRTLIIEISLLRNCWEKKKKRKVNGIFPFGALECSCGLK